MEHPLLNVIQQKEELITNFTGYNHTLTATEGSYYDMRNMSSDYYPAMSPRSKTKTVLSSAFDKFEGMVDKEGVIWWVNDKKLYNTRDLLVSGISFTTNHFKQIVKMGTKLVFFPDKKWYDTKDDSYGDLGKYKGLDGQFEWRFARDDGTIITGLDLISPTPQDGDYKKETVNGKPVIYQYSATTQTWNPVTPVYTAISFVYDAEHPEYTNPFDDFKEGDAVTLSMGGAISPVLTTYERNNVYINKEDDASGGGLSNTFVILKKITNGIVIPVESDYEGYRSIHLTHVLPHPPKYGYIERKIPDMSFVIECQNRLWGCSSDGHEVYASKLGDPTNWNVFQGISTDSWAATVGSDGVFTGAINYKGNPLFFKEDSIIKVSISSVGGHSLTETKCRGVQRLSDRSLAIVNDVLYYKAPDCICAYDGSYPISISNVLGDEKYSWAVSGSYKDKYYVSMVDSKAYKHLFVYDTKYGIWVKAFNQTDGKQILQFCNSNNCLLFTTNSKLYTIGNESNSLQVEAPVDWFIESNNIGYLYTGKGNRSRINKKQYIQKMIMQVSLAVGSHISVYINYDSSDEWEFLYNFSGSNANLCKIPIRPHRCNHFRYKIVGHGDAKIYSITKYYTEGSDV